MLVHLAPELRTLVRQSMEVLGRQFAFHYGQRAHRDLLRVRREMVRLRRSSQKIKVEALEKLHIQFSKLSPQQRRVMAHGFSLMMEVTNACENAYRTHRLRQRPKAHTKSGSKNSGQVTWVLTAHPTESRSKIMLPMLLRLQGELLLSLENGWREHEDQIASLLSVITHSPLAPSEKPEPEDEADYLFAVSLRTENLSALASQARLSSGFRLKTWVGGDKDGHPGVDEKTFLYSLHRSRAYILSAAETWLRTWRQVAIVNSKYQADEVDRLLAELTGLKRIRAGDFSRVARFKKSSERYFKSLADEAAHRPYSQRLKHLFQLFPALVVPLEMREASDVIEEFERAKPAQRSAFNIYRMLRALKDIAGARSARHYVDCLVISMTRDHRDLLMARNLIQRAGLKTALDVVPLFETLAALLSAEKIVTRFLNDHPNYVQQLRKQSNSRMQIMLGYSDSAKESGVSASRMNVARTFNGLERALKRFSLKPLFFHGMGGSEARGGGSLDEQTSAWSADMLKHFKATYQGEVVSKTFSDPAILLSQINRVHELQSHSRSGARARPEQWREFADHVCAGYRRLVGDPRFLDLVKTATLYPYLHELRLGSRPSKRKSLTGVGDLRAIPWVLCWTQARLLLPTWWGTGQAWRAMSPAQRKHLKTLFTEGEGSWSAMIKLLRFTLAKVEPAVFEFMVRRLAPQHKAYVEEFNREFRLACQFARELTGDKDLMAHKPWLGESIFLRSPLIHPLNVLQVIAVRKEELELLRITTTGIASGMLTTG